MNNYKDTSYSAISDNIKDDTVLFMGSSEFHHGAHTPTFPAKVLKKQGIDAMCIGSSYNQSLSHATALAAVGPKLKSKKVILMVSPSWFNPLGVAAHKSAFAVRFSETEYIGMDASGFGRGYGVTGAQTSLRRADDRGNMKWWCRFPKNRNLHHHFQRLRASAAGAGVNLPVERSLNRCGPVKRGAWVHRMMSQARRCSWRAALLRTLQGRSLLSTAGSSAERAQRKNQISAKNFNKNEETINMKRVVITGMGAVTPVGNTAGESCWAIRNNYVRSLEKGGTPLPVTEAALRTARGDM